MKLNSPEFKRHVFKIIEIGNINDEKSRLFDVILAVTIVVNVAVQFMETFEELAFLKPLFNAIELISVVFFIIEYLLRLWTSDLLYPGKSKKDAMIAFIFSLDGIIELLTILPLYFLTGFVVFRMLRVVRIFRLFRINNTVDSFNVIASVISEKKNQLASSFFIIFILMLASSICMYSVEHGAQPQAFRNAFSGIWWSVSALLTVGYGDIYPITTTGKIIAIIISFLGVCAVAIPTGIISAGFVEQINKAQIDPDALNVHTNTVIIDIDSKWLDKTIAEIEQESHLQVAVLKRDDVLIKPDPDLVIKLKDSLLTFSQKPMSL